MNKSSLLDKFVTILLDRVYDIVPYTEEEEKMLANIFRSVLLDSYKAISILNKRYPKMDKNLLHKIISVIRELKEKECLWKTQ